MTYFTALYHCVHTALQYCVDAYTPRLGLPPAIFVFLASFEGAISPDSVPQDFLFIVICRLCVASGVVYFRSLHLTRLKLNCSYAVIKPPQTIVQVVSPKCSMYSSKRARGPSSEHTPSKVMVCFPYRSNLCLLQTNFTVGKEALRALMLFMATTADTVMTEIQQIILMPTYTQS